jgi:hypothetical protein
MCNCSKNKCNCGDCFDSSSIVLPFVPQIGKSNCNIVANINSGTDGNGDFLQISITNPPQNIVYQWSIVTTGVPTGFTITNTNTSKMYYDFDGEAIGLPVLIKLKLMYENGCIYEAYHLLLITKLGEES